MVSSPSQTAQSRLAMECECGSYLRRKATPDAVGPAAAKDPSPMDASFVHLPPSLLLPQQGDSQTAGEQRTTDHRNPRHREFLEGISNQTFHSALCVVCVEQIEQALDIDLQRLEVECRLYRNATHDEKTRQQSQLRAIQSSCGSTTTTTTALEKIQDDLRHEVARLEEVCQEQEAELQNLTNLLMGATAVSKQLDCLQWDINEEANALELESHAFDNEEQQILAELTEVQTEVDRLSSTGIRFPTRLLDMRVDSARGLRYPLINELRLAYRPKGDLEWNEIQAAWSLAAQLLLESATLLNFQSRHWRIVPLSQCAKIIYYHSSGGTRGVVHNVGHRTSNCSEALIAWNSLLCEAVQYALATVQAGAEKGFLEKASLPKLPFAQAAGKIGSVPLALLDVNDDASWSRVVHFLSCNLLWLANVASVWTKADVVISAVDLS